MIDHEPEKPVMQLHHWINHKVYLQEFTAISYSSQMYKEFFLMHFDQWFNLNYQNKQ